jgi:hypothetical protein
MIGEISKNSVDDDTLSHWMNFTTRDNMAK